MSHWATCRIAPRLSFGFIHQTASHSMGSSFSTRYGSGCTLLLYRCLYSFHSGRLQHCNPPPLSLSPKCAAFKRWHIYKWRSLGQVFVERGQRAERHVERLPRLLCEKGRTDEE